MINHRGLLDGTPVVVHNSFDGRELVEPLTTILS